MENLTAKYCKQSNHVFIPKTGIAPVLFMEYLMKFRKEKNRSLNINFRKEEILEGEKYFKIKFEREQINFNHNCLEYINDKIIIKSVTPKYPIKSKVFSIYKKDGVYKVVSFEPRKKMYTLEKNGLTYTKPEYLLQLY